MLLVQDGERTYQLTGRVAAMVRWLAGEAERVNRLPQLRLEFNCSGFKSIKPRLEICEREVLIDQ